MAHDVLKDVLKSAINAPSGDNAQPWEFELGENSISIFNVPGKDATLYNFRERGSYFAHGALVENIRIAASKAGLVSEVKAFPGTPHCTAIVTFEPHSSHLDTLYEAIAKRMTNRKPYVRKKLDAADREKMLTSLKDNRGVSLRLVENEASMQALAESMSVNEQLLFENQNLHDFLFGMIRWTKEEEAAKPGLYVKTMEFPAPLQMLLRYVFRHWKIVELLNVCGLSRAIRKQSAALYTASSAFGAIVIEGESDAVFLEAGQAFQRVWLTATNIGLSIQPTAAIPYLAQRIRAGEADMFSTKHIELIENAYDRLVQEFNIKENESIGMLFRLGYGDKPSAQSAKLPPILRV